VAEKSYDVIIVGGGIMGSSTAYNLKRSEEKIKVVVVEMDPTYSHASSTLSLANIRIQFSLKENIQISQHAYEVLERFDEEMGVDDEKAHIAFHREGNLFLVAPEGRSR
jgi:glycine/D-amino acid oxidase-like deaminating enzyme